MGFFFAERQRSATREARCAVVLWIGSFHNPVVLGFWVFQPMTSDLSEDDTDAMTTFGFVGESDLDTAIFCFLHPHDGHFMLCAGLVSNASNFFRGYTQTQRYGRILATRWVRTAPTGQGEHQAYNEGAHYSYADRYR
jgi:hypothetical protein